MRSLSALEADRTLRFGGDGNRRHIRDFHKAGKELAKKPKIKRERDQKSVECQNEGKFPKKLEAPGAVSSSAYTSTFR